MFFSRHIHFRNRIVLSGLLLVLMVLPATAGLTDLFGTQELDETERKETIERIQTIQEKLKLLQEKLKVLERRKAAEQAAQKAQDTAAGKISSLPVQVNWLPVDETKVNPGEFGLYTYLLFKGELSDKAAVGALEDFILTIETLPENDIPPGLANRFLVPVEKPQSMVNLGRQPYDFKLSRSYLQRLNLPGNLPDGPLLVSTGAPLDPFGSSEVPAFLAVSLGHQTPQRALELAKVWHDMEKEALPGEESVVSGLFWTVIDGAGPTQVVSNRQHTLVTLPQP
jgi:hypothetical protein